MLAPPRAQSPAPSLTRFNLPGATVAEPAESINGKFTALLALLPMRFRVRSKVIGAAMVTEMAAVWSMVLSAVGTLSVISRLSRLMPVTVVPAAKAAPVKVEPMMMFSTLSRTTLETPWGARIMYWTVERAE